MHVDITGSGQPILFLHGGGVSGWMWRPVLRHLAGAFRAIVPDLPGHGQSRGMDYVSHDETVAQLAGLIREVAPSGVGLIGFSLGAQLAMRLASEHPELVRGAVIVSGEARPAPLQSTTMALLKWAAPLARREWFARLQAKQLSVPDDLLGEYVRDSQGISRVTLLSSVGENIRFTLPGAWSAFHGGTTVMVGAKERPLMRDSARLIHEALDGSRLVVVPNAAHDVPFTHPELLADVIRQQLAV
ncbi:hypothetical protein ART_1122 [Arthrobacter sp. PAMC 25486]|uniref:alpha/beta fold hydrolase n=1 Tax=Arthrobacter sp. PAMC 25486 TaxID=1494608 RepID=UPI000535E192|nr:alpha/beta hydrolase [Arthrobacter sp. PAMC 25486]AIY00721.1 hypothetical protein ART_1122 [Arthrobacter sp. PAMC 25486]